MYKPLTGLLVDCFLQQNVPTQIYYLIFVASPPFFFGEEVGQGNRNFK